MMRKYILILLTYLVSLGAKGQELDSLQVIEKAKTYFKDVFVENTFKDPYSYELLKIISEPVSYRQKAISEYSYNKNMVPFNDEDIEPLRLELKKNKEYLDKLKPKGTKYEKALAKYERSLAIYEDENSKLNEFKNKQELLNQISTATSKSVDEISHYNIEIHCYGSNSYGGKILGKYIFEINTKGEVITAPFEKFKF